MSKSDILSKSTRSRRMKKAGTALAFTAAVTLGGMALAAPANAASIGRVGETTHPTDGSWHAVWSSAWSPAWNDCRAKFSQTKSVALVTYTPINSAGDYYSIWECRNQ